ncbi:MAG: hypothetical protein QOJ63_2237 [Solirubrobacteraceae bacterium]|nr:hypothetical protein [Solirubrobacteraceae bacterium]
MTRAHRNLLAPKRTLIGAGTALVLTGALLVGGSAGAAAPSAPTKSPVTAPASITLPPGGNLTSTATCPAGTTVMSGGGKTSTINVDLTDSYKSGNGWAVRGTNRNTSDATITAEAYCMASVPLPSTTTAFAPANG